MMKLLLVSVCLAFAFAGGHQHFGCSFDDNLLISKRTSSRSHEYGNSLKDWGHREAKVPYFFAEGIQEADKDVVRKEMQRITQHVPCIRFNEKTKRDVPQHHLEIRVGNTWGCSGNYPWSWGTSFNGYVETNRYWYGEKVLLVSTNRLANTAWCGERPSIKGGVLHELMHVLGIAHTQKRFDRDYHVKVNESCIIPDKYGSNLHQYEKTKEGDLWNYHVPYKCNSIMHYKDTTLSIDREKCKTMTPISASCTDTGIGSNEAIEEDWELLKQAHCIQ